jgi:hypothetical protein
VSVSQIFHKRFRRTRNVTELGGDYKEVGIFDLRIYLVSVILSSFSDSSGG